jgi:hypothetical protein
MKGTAAIVKQQVDNFQPGKVFNYSSFSGRKGNSLALAKSLSRMAKVGQIARLSRGNYYKPVKSVFGDLKPDENQVILALTQKRGETVGYVTGLTAYNVLGLTSQVSNTLMIARRSLQPDKALIGYNVRYVKRDFNFTKEDVKLLQILDAFKDIKSIPDVSVSDALKLLVSAILKLEEKEVRNLVRLSFNYPPSVHALVGAVIENNIPGMSIVSLYRSLNPLSRYNFGIDQSVLPNKSKWNIA